MLGRYAQIFILLSFFGSCRGQWGESRWQFPSYSTAPQPSSAQISQGRPGGCRAGHSGACGTFPALPVKFPPQPRNTCTHALRCECYTNRDNYQCCNRELESFMRCHANNPCNRHRWRGSNLQRFATEMQQLLQQQFGRSFEVITGSGEFCGRHSFKGDMMCKIKTPDCKTLMVYATSQQYSTSSCDFNTPLSEGELALKQACWGQGGFENSDI